MRCLYNEAILLLFSPHKKCRSSLTCLLLHRASTRVPQIISRIHCHIMLYNIDLACIVTILMFSVSCAHIGRHMEGIVPPMWNLFTRNVASCHFKPDATTCCSGSIVGLYRLYANIELNSTCACNEMVEFYESYRSFIGGEQKVFRFVLVGASDLDNSVGGGSLSLYCRQVS